MNAFIAVVMSTLMLLVFLVVSFVFVDRTFFADDPIFDFAVTTGDVPLQQDDRGQENTNDKKQFTMTREAVSQVRPVPVRRNDTAARYIQMLDYRRKSEQTAPNIAVTEGYGVVILDQIGDQFLTQILPEIKALGQPNITIADQSGRTTVYGAQTAQEQKMIQQYLRDTYYLDTFLTMSYPRSERE